MRIATIGALLLAGCAGDDTRVAIVLGDSPVQGPAAAFLTIVEFADFQCPYCKREAAAVDALRAAWPDDLRVVFKHFPIQGHNFARGAALASECAHRQGRFWEMHAQLFANQGSLDDGMLEGYARLAGVADLAAWNACRTGEEAKARVDGDQKAGYAAGVSATPTLFLNGIRIEGALPLEDLRALAEAELEQATGSGIPAAEYYDRVVMR